MTTKVLIFGPASTSLQSVLIAVMPGQCVQFNAWNLGPGDTVCVDMIRVSGGEIQTGGDSCVVSPGLVGQMSLDATPYAPCNSVLCMDETRNMIVLSTPGTYRLTLDPPAALGTVVVEATFHVGDGSCPAIGSECCCMPESPWLGSSVNPCLTITPGGPAGHNPIFDLSVCCLLQQVTNVQVPQLSDEVIFLSGGSCFRTTIDELFSNAIVCDSLAEFPLGAPAAGDELVGIDAGATCVRRDAETLVEFFETPWTGVSTTPALVITPGGVNGHGPTFSYDLCADIQALPSCACTPNTGDEVLIIQGGQCTLATWPEIDACAQMGAFAVGALIVGDNVFVREAGGTCKQVPATAFGGSPAFPLLAPDGSCAAPSYSFTASPDSGMFYTGTAVRIGDDNCVDFIEIGASINIVSTLSNISLSATAAGGTIALATENILASASGFFNLNSASNGLVQADTLILLGGSGGLSAQLGGSSTLQVLQTGVGSIQINSAGSDIIAQAFTDFIVQTGALFSTRLDITSVGEWFVAGTAGTAGQALTSNGLGASPTWQTPSATVRLNEVADANGSATRAHGANVITWGWSGIGLGGGPTFVISESASSTGATLAEFISTTAGGNFVTPLRASWQSGGVFSTGGAVASGCMWRGSGGALGQEITIESGSNTAGNGGSLNLRGGNSTGNTGGGAAAAAGSGIQGGNASLTGGISTGSATTGGDAVVTGGANTHGGGGFAGDVYLTGGACSFNPTERQGNVFANYALANAIAASAVKGFFYLPKIAAAPTGTPTFSALTGNALPFIAEISGATIVLWAHDGVAWRSATLV